MEETDSDNRTALYQAINCKNWEVVDYLLLQGAKTDTLPEDAINDILEHFGEDDDIIRRAFEYDNEDLFRRLKGRIASDALAAVYSEAKAKNLPISHEVDVQVQEQLLDSIFRTENLPTKNSTDFETIKSRLIHTIDLIDSLRESHEEDVLRSQLKIAALNLRALKQLLWFTYNEVPWEEMEFCVISYVSSEKKDVACRLVLDRRRLLRHLDHFNVKLKAVRDSLKKEDFKSKAETLTGRSEKIKAIGKKFFVR